MVESDELGSLIAVGDIIGCRVVVKRERLLDERLPCVGELNDN